MYTYVEIFDKLGVDAYYVKFSIRKHAIHLEKPKGFTKEILDTIPIEAIEHPVFDTYLGNPRFSFSYQDTYYIFHEYSQGLTDYINQKIAQTV